MNSSKYGITYDVFDRPLVGLSGITRFSRRLKVRDENVAEHMWYVSYFTLKLCNNLKVSDTIRLLALEYAICHDVPEIALDDVNHDVKQKFPVIKDQLAQEERKLFKELGDDILQVHINKDNSEYVIARAIVELADIHSVAMYTQSEKNIGNTYFAQIYEDTLVRIKEQEKHLKEALTYASQVD